MQRFDPRIYLFACGHFSVDWAQSAIPALLPYFISVCHLSYQDAGTLIFANILLASIFQPPSSATTPTRSRNPGLPHSAPS